MSKRRILVAEDDANIRIGLIDTLESEGYEAVGASDGVQAIAALKQGNFDLAILDIMMPGKDGYAVCQELRRWNQRIAVIMLTAKSQEIDKVIGLRLGADDYISKPFGIQELLARVAASLRRSSLGLEAADDALPDVLDFGAFRANRKTYEVESAQGREPLTAREVILLEQFNAHANEPLTRDALLNAGWGIDYLGTTRTLDQHIAQLRKKLNRIGAGDSIETVHGIGYRWRSVS